MVLISLLALALSPAAHADPVAQALERIDQALAPHGARRVEAPPGVSYCQSVAPEPEAWVVNRQELCLDAALVGQWVLTDLRAEGGQRVEAQLGVLRYADAAAAARARERSWVRYGDGTVGLHRGATAWCYADALWSGDLLWTLEYGCHISLPHVAALAGVRSILRGLAEPWRGAVGVVGTHSGWSGLVDATGADVRAADADRGWTWARVRGVAHDDVLWIREHPPGPDAAMGARIDRLLADSTCLPVLQVQGTWWQVVGPGRTGWTAGRFLEAQPREACVRPE